MIVVLPPWTTVSPPINNTVFFPVNDRLPHSDSLCEYFERLTLPCGCVAVPCSRRVTTRMATAETNGEAAPVPGAEKDALDTPIIEESVSEPVEVRTVIYNTFALLNLFNSSSIRYAFPIPRT